MSSNALPSWRVGLQWLTLVVCFGAILLLMMWPGPLLPDAGTAVDHALVSLVFGGLCLGLVAGSGFLQQQPRWQWSLATLCGWLAFVKLVLAMF